MLDITGQRFGRLVALKVVDKPDRQGTYWLCKCDCGKEKAIHVSSLRRGATTSCGCFHKECVSKLAKKKYNEYEIAGDIVYVKMIHSKTMICDIDDWMKLKDICWSADRNGYAIGKNMEFKKNVKFHQQVMGKKEGYFIDHINRNRLDNRKSNLRFVTPKGNGWNVGIGKKNKSGVLGVYKHKDKWCATINTNRKSHHIGIYETLEEATKARKEAELKYHPISEEIFKED